MPNRHNMTGANQSVETELLDHEGNVILEIVAREYMVHEPDGSITTKRLNQSIELMCGLQWHPGLASGADGLLIGVCELCRHPRYRFPFRDAPRHGLVSLAKAHQCIGCGLLLCPRHQKMGADGQVRCPTCGRRHTLKRGVLRIFFKEV